MKDFIYIFLVLLLLSSCSQDNNVIVYETVDNKPLSIKPSIQFGVNLVDHSFVSGKGRITFDGPVTEIPDLAFQGTALSAIELPRTVKKIGKEAFALCTDLKKCNIPVQCDTISNQAFLYCPVQFKEINVTHIAPMAFLGCWSLDTVVLSDKIRSIGSEAFAGSALESITLPIQIDSIKNRTFYECKNLKYVVNLEKVRYLGEEAFDGCAFDSISIPSGVTEIPDNCFANNVNLKHIKLHSNIHRIGKAAFWNCKSLQSIEIPEGVAIIDDQAFAYCDNLKTVIMPSNLDSVGDNIFEACPFLCDSIVNN